MDATDLVWPAGAASVLQRQHTQPIGVEPPPQWPPHKQEATGLSAVPPITKGPE